MKDHTEYPDSPDHVVKQHSAIVEFLNIEFHDKNLRATFYDINLDCKEKESKKSENLVYDLDYCKPRQNTMSLKIVGQYTISRNI